MSIILNKAQLAEMKACKDICAAVRGSSKVQERAEAGKFLKLEKSLRKVSYPQAPQHSSEQQGKKEQVMMSSVCVMGAQEGGCTVIFIHRRVHRLPSMASFSFPLECF